MRVLFIGGEGRSGSTLLDRAVGQIPGFFSAGELRQIWGWGVARNALCGCGTPFRDCDFWGAVGKEAFGGWGQVDPGAIERLAREAERRALTGAVSMNRHPRLGPYERHLIRLYEAIRARSGATVVVDSSKAPAAAFVLRAAGLEVRAVHLVRDSRAVAHSWSRLVPRPDAGGAEMHRFGPLHIGGRWMARNLLMELLARSGTPTERVRYEDLVSNPAVVLKVAVGLAGGSLDSNLLPVGAGGDLLLASNHTVMGNPGRMRTGSVPLSLDDEWRSRMSGRSRRVVRAVTWPLARRYGYRS